MAYCPSCVSYGNECDVDYEDWNQPCSYYKTAESEFESEEEEEV